MKKNMRKKAFEFHPFELAFCGSSGSGKTTLLSAVLEELHGKLDVGVVKHCGKGYDLHPVGKDSTRFLEKKVGFVVVHDDKSAALLSNSRLNTSQTLGLMLSKDAVLIEGHQYSSMPKIAVLGKGRKNDDIADSVFTGSIDSIVAIVSQDREQVQKKRIKIQGEDRPVFHRDDVKGIAAFVLNFLQMKARNTPVYGLLLTGGRSSRMGEDKALLRYGEETQLSRAMKLLNKVCEKSFVSRRADQVDDERAQYDSVLDSFIEMGPLGGILSALHAHPNAAWLVLAIDLPFASEKMLSGLVKGRDALALATGYRNVERGFIEPLITLYEPKARQVLLMEMAAGKRCPRRMLAEHRVRVLERSDDKALENINTPEERNAALNKISR